MWLLVHFDNQTAKADCYHGGIVVEAQWSIIQYNGLYFKRVACVSDKTDDPVALYKVNKDMKI